MILCKQFHSFTLHIFRQIFISLFSFSLLFLFELSIEKFLQPFRSGGFGNLGTLGEMAIQSGEYHVVPRPCKWEIMFQNMAEWWVIHKWKDMSDDRLYVNEGCGVGWRCVVHCAGCGVRVGGWGLRVAG